MKSRNNKGCPQMPNCTLITNVLTTIIVALETPDQLPQHVGVLVEIGVDLMVASDPLVGVALTVAKRC